MIADLRSAKGLAKKARTMQQEYLYRRYEIHVVAEYSRLIKKVQAPTLDSRPKIYIYLEEIFDLIEKEHIAVGHGGRDRTYAACKKWFENVSYEFVIQFISCCKECNQNNRANTITNMVIKPLRSDDYLSRMQIDLIDLQSFPDGRFKWILTFQDHFTKFVFLRALEQKKSCRNCDALIRCVSSIWRAGDIAKR